MNQRDQKLYKGFRDSVDSEAFVYVDDEPLDANPGPYKLYSTGYGWGPDGFKSLKLSFAIIMDYTEDTALSLKRYEDFECFVISRIRVQKWNMCGLYIKEWLKTFGGYDGRLML